MVETQFILDVGKITAGVFTLIPGHYVCVGERIQIKTFGNKHEASI